MKRIKQEVSNEITVKNIKGYFEKNITRFGNGAKIDAPKEHLGKKVIVLVIEE
jgi:putative transposon-encoded protein